MQTAGYADAFARAERFARENPELVVAAGALVIITIVGALALLRYRRPVGVRFKQALEDRDHVAVLMHPDPDPDAMAAAVGVGHLAEQVGCEATLQFTGQIRHQENRAFRNVLDLDIQGIDHVSELAAESVVLVDHNQPRGFEGADGVLPFAVVDHHPGEGTGEEFTDVRTDYGASASIVAEYFSDVGGKPVPPDVHESEVNARFTLPSRECTGLLYGILADTRHLTSGASSADFSAAASLAPGVDEDSLDRIANPQVSGETLDVKARAIAGRQVEGSFAVSDVGTLSNADAIPQAADELITLEGITAVVVVGEREGTVHLSGRSRDDRVHMGRALENAVEGVPDAGAGGHARMGGGQLPADEEPSREALIESIFDSLEGDV
ncbi:DHH family phosphoesterase [Halolamina salifodinae]|uniref:NanoRNase/pAp phosphatase (C-di-AMP/oligoRNAs hydrolase) n=1 Tax=Halolamina salifodinae TaxID=1202767 RepID=A0A8T4GRY1_9EURY|nr:DHHA1 domain-containing protein [Halolamina salifodinae]MBP1985901.1 nanoRNase/pAp phosphatase (c-di-AMP/oligoRNAs hydrolase) [Halolamina salifodinae]